MKKIFCPICGYSLKLTVITKGQWHRNISDDGEIDAKLHYSYGKPVSSSQLECQNFNCSFSYDCEQRPLKRIPDLDLWIDKHLSDVSKCWSTC